MTFKLEKIARKYTKFLIRHYVLVLVIGCAVTAICGYSASRFKLKTAFTELLPQDEPSIKDLEKAKSRKGGLSNFIIAVMGDNLSANEKLVDDIVSRLATLPPKYSSYIKYHINNEREFYTKYKHLYADLEDLKIIHERLRAKIRYERIKNNPVLNIDLDGEELEPVEVDFSDFRKKYEKKIEPSKRYINGYLTGEEGKLFAILMYPAEPSTTVDFGVKMLVEVKKAVAEVCTGQVPTDNKNLDSKIALGCSKKYDPTTTVGFTGSVVTAIDEQNALVADLVLVTCICLFFVGLVVLLYFRSIRALPTIALPLLMGTTWTFGISYYIVHSLNSTTAFLAAIIVGNGINFGLIQLARYFEQRRTGQSLEEALSNALYFTSKATSTAAFAASIAYGSLIITNFRGFNGFGYMGGIGMLLCWISSFTLQPAFLILLEKIRPAKFTQKRRLLPAGLFSKPYAAFVVRFGGTLHIFGWAFAAICIVYSLPYLKNPFEYDFRNLRNKIAKEQGSGVLSSRVDTIFPRRLNPMFILADRQDQIPLIMEELARNNESGPNKALFKEIVSIYSYLPSDQKAKIKILRKIRKLLSKSTLSWLDDEDRKKVKEFMPPEKLDPITVKDMPFTMVRLFKELDGRVGLPVALYPNNHKSTWDGHFLIELSEASRKVVLPDGETVTSAGVATIFADMLKAIVRDGPRAVVVSLVGVMLLVFLVYRSIHLISLVIIALIFGVIWTIGPIAMIDLKLNFLNFIGLPITFGIGIDYAVNILNRYKAEGPGSIQKVIANTGGAVILCSLTTLIGYSSLLIANNQALVSFGLLADIGEVASLSAAVFLLPVLIHFYEEVKTRMDSHRSRKLTTSTNSVDQG